MESVGILVVFAIFLVLLIGMNVYRANKQRAESDDLINSLEKGDKIKTYSGLYGTIEEIKEIKEDEKVVEKVAVINLDENTKVKIDARSIFHKVENSEI
ncbi:MAG: preprotein translocase subunit YajC [Halanaerobiales bacterium]